MSGAPTGRFRWCVGVEDTAIGVPIRHSGRTLDEYQLTEHYERFRADLDMAASLGIDAIRYGVPWYRVNPARGVFVWDWVDAAIEHAAVGCGLTVIADIVHYGVPAWVSLGFADPEYPGAIAEFARAFAERYGNVVCHVTPLNEPTITAAFCGESGGWPPYLSGPEGWVQVVLGVAEGIQRTVDAVRSVRSDTTIVHVEAAKVLRPALSGLAEARELAAQRAFLPTDLVLGRVGRDHPLHDWLLGHGASEERLAGIRAAAVDLDVLGINFYPDFSVRDVARSHGSVLEVAGGGTGADLLEALRLFHTRYQRPIFVSETSVDGNPQRQVAWLRESIEAVERATAEGLPVWGYTWWPLFDFVDWGIAANGFAFEDFRIPRPTADGGVEFVPPPPPGMDSRTGTGVGTWLRRMGLWRLVPGPDGLERVASAAVDAYRHVIATSSLSQGHRQVFRPGSSRTCEP